MGNENSAEGAGISMRRSQYNDKRRRTTLSGHSDIAAYSRNLESPRKSLAMGDVTEREEQYEKSHGDGEDVADRAGQSRHANENADRILQRLNRRNQELRKELRQISLMLSEKLEKRKMVVKKKYETGDAVDASASKGIKRELQNAYKQIDMYKRQIQALRGKQEGDKGYIKVDRLENDIATKDKEIESLMDKIRACRNIKKGQQKVIEKDLNQDQMGMIESYKQEIENLKTKLKEISKRDRVRQENYKRQQAYLYEVEKKLRTLNGEYFPDIKKDDKEPLAKKRFDVQSEKVDDSQKKTLPSAKEFNILQSELAQIKKRHDQYHKKIDNMILLKNKHAEERQSVENALKQKSKIIDGLKLKVEQLKKLGKVNKKNLFGNDESQQPGSIEGGEEEKEEEPPEPVDAFNIDHLIANIPKPNRPVRKTNITDDNSLNLQLMRADVSADDSRQAKVWNPQKNRRQEKGEHHRGEILFDDKKIFPEGAEPKMVGINLWQTHDGNITGLQAIYTHNDDIKQGLKSSNPNGNLAHFDLKLPDYIKSIGGGFGANGMLEYIVFVSKQGAIGRFGNVNESLKQFNFDIQQGERPCLLSGASRLFNSDVRISMLNVDICRQ